MVDGSEREVLTSRLCNLNLETLESYNFSSPHFFRNLQKLTDRVRNRYISPARRPPEGLQMIDPAEPGQEKLAAHGNEDLTAHSQDDLDPPPQQITDPPPDLPPTPGTDSFTDHGVTSNDIGPGAYAYTN